MLIATLTALFILFFAGDVSEGSTESQLDRASQLLAQHVTEDERAIEVQAAMQEMRDVLNAFDLEFVDLRRQAATVDANYDATSADYDRVFSQLEESWLRTQRRIVSLRFRMLANMTREEWDSVFGALRHSGGE